MRPPPRIVAAASAAPVASVTLPAWQTVWPVEAALPARAAQPDREQAAARMRLRFGKAGAMRYLSHLELITVFTRAVSRGGVPVLFSQGFHPHPRFSFATATSVGVESTAEYMDMFVADGHARPGGDEPAQCGSASRVCGYWRRSRSTLNRRRFRP